MGYHCFSGFLEVCYQTALHIMHLYQFLILAKKFSWLSICSFFFLFTDYLKGMPAAAGAVAAAAVADQMLGPKEDSRLAIVLVTN